MPPHSAVVEVDVGGSVAVDVEVPGAPPASVGSSMMTLPPQPVSRPTQIVRARE